MSSTPHVLVVGAGIVGASAAWHLLRAGARVTVLEADAPGGLATRASFAWINASVGNPYPYFRLRVRAMQEWHTLERELPGLAVRWIGSLYWELPPDERRRFVAEHASWGYDIHAVDRDDILRLEPGLAAPPAVAAYAPTEGCVEPAAAACALLTDVERFGGKVITDTPARSLAMQDGRICGVETGTGRLAADEVVVAAGVGAAPLLATAGVTLPLLHRPGVQITTRPHTTLLNGMIMTPGAAIRQSVDGRVIAVTSIDNGADGPAAALALLEVVQRMFASGEALVLERHVIGYRPMPQDELPVIGRVDAKPGLYVTVTHSGVTLAPVLGRFVAEEILSGRRDGLLAPYGFERFGQG